jgi:multidrug efflux pump
VLAIVGMGKVQKQFFPNSTRLELNVELRLPEGASITAIDAETRKLEEWLDKDKAEFDQHEHYIAYVGSGSPRYSWASTSNWGQQCQPVVIVTRSVEAREALRGRLIQHFENRGSRRARQHRPHRERPAGRLSGSVPVSGEDMATLRGSPARSPNHARQPGTLERQSRLERTLQGRRGSKSTRTRRACSAFPARISPRCSTCR